MGHAPLLGVAALLSGGALIAQEFGQTAGLRATLGVTSTGSTAPTGASPTAATSEPLGQPAIVPGNRSLRRAASRRSRTSTSGPVQAAVRSPLPPLVAPGLRPPLDGEAASAVAAAPVRRREPEDPYAQLGLRLGGLTLYPSVGENIGYDTNPNRTQSRRGSFVSQTDGELRVQSDWSRHELSGFLRGAYNEYTAVPSASRPEGSGRLALRLDVTRDTIVNVDGRYQIDTQRPDSPELNTAVRTRPVVYNEGASVGVTHRFNRLLATLQGTIDRSDFESAQSASGLLIDQSDRNLTQLGARARLGYELTPGLIPFVEALGDTRIYDRRVDFSGFARSSDGIGARAGTAFEISRLLTGEIAVGGINRRYDDPRLGNLTSPLVDGSLVWSLSPLTTIRASAQALVDETTVAGATGVRTLRGSVEVSHDLRRNLNVTAGLIATDFDYQGVRLTETGLGAKIRAEYKLTRWMAVRATYLFEYLESSRQNGDYTANVFLVGMRFTP